MDNLQILLVDDVEANLISLEYLLNDYFDHINIIKAINGEEALKIIFTKHIDLIILDIQMPIMDGFETATYIKQNKKTQNIPIIFLTAALKDEEFKQRGFEVGAVDYLTKPINDYQLINKLRLYIELFRKNKQLLEQQALIHQQSKLASMGEMIANIAHQWRQPLSTISTSATGMLVQKEYGVLDDKTFENSCNLIDKNAQYLSKTIEDFRNYFKNDAKIELFSIKDNMLNTINLLETTITQENIQLFLNVNDDIKIQSYPNELQQSIINIINNAIDSLKNIDKQNRYIFIDIQNQDNKIIISIKDNGGGIQDDIKEKIFEPYWTTKHQSQGTGLGLSIVYNLITNLLNGKVYIKNEQYTYEGNQYIGANFIIELNK